MSIFSNLNQTIEKKGSAYVVLIDPDRKNINSLDQNVRVGNHSNVDAFFVIGAHNSSNSIRLVETAKRFGCKYSELIENINDFDYSTLAEFNTIGLTASASAPEEQLNMFIDQIKKVYAIEVLNFKEDENITFKIPNFLN